MRYGLIFGLLLSTLASPLHAQMIGQPAPELTFTRRDGEDNQTEKLKLVGKRGLIVILYFFRTNDAPSAEYVDKANKSGRIPGVDVIFISPNKQEEVKTFIETKEIPEGWTIWEAESICSLYDVSHYPRCYIVDPQGLIAWRGHPGELDARLKDQIRLTPPLGAGEATLTKKLDTAQKMLSTKKLGVAYTLCKQVIDLTAEGDSLNGKAITLRDQIEKAVEKRLEDAKKAFENKKYQEAAEILAEIKVRMEGRDIVKTAEGEISRVRGTRESKKLYEDGLRDVRAEMLLESALEQLELKRFVDAERQLREVTEKFDEAPTAILAQETLEKMHKDPEVLAAVKAHYDQLQADRWYDIGDRFSRLGLVDQAREYFKKVVDTYPKSEAAKRAETAMKKLSDKKKT